MRRLMEIEDIYIPPLGSYVLTRWPSPILSALLAGFVFSLIMTVYTAGLRPSDNVEPRVRPLFRDFTPSDTAEVILGLLGDRGVGGPVYMPTQGCETFRFETYWDGVLIMYYCGDGLKAATYYAGNGRSFDPLSLYRALGGGSTVVENDSGGLYDVVRVYQRVGDVKILQTGLQAVVDRGTGAVRKIIFYPIYDIGDGSSIPKPNPSKALTALDNIGLGGAQVRLEGALICGSSIGYLFTIYHDGWVYPRYAEALVDAYSGGLIYLKLIHEYGVDVILDSTC
jgi:hypothetical protein